MIKSAFDLLKEYEIYISKESLNIVKEYHSYYWTEMKDGTIINKPLDRMNHCMDAMRYLTFSSFGKQQNFFVI